MYISAFNSMQDLFVIIRQCIVKHFNDLYNKKSNNITNSLYSSLLIRLCKIKFGLSEF